MHIIGAGSAGLRAGSLRATVRCNERQRDGHWRRGPRCCGDRVRGPGRAHRRQQV